MINLNQLNINTVKWKLSWLPKSFSQIRNSQIDLFCHFNIFLFYLICFLIITHYSYVWKVWCKLQHTFSIMFLYNNEPGNKDLSICWNRCCMMFFLQSAIKPDSAVTAAVLGVFQCVVTNMKFVRMCVCECLDLLCLHLALAWKGRKD